MHPEPLSERLKRATRDVHERVENCPVPRAIFSGAINREAYRDYLARLLPVYTNMETGLSALEDHPALGVLYQPDILRAPAIASDLRFFGGDPDQVFPSTLSRRIAGFLPDQPHRLVAAFYVRLFGDLSGGQILKRKLAGIFGVDPASPQADGLRFYAFPDEPKPAVRMRQFRQQIDAIPLSHGDADDVVQTALRLFNDHPEILGD
jgi:heme oxygenase